MACWNCRPLREWRIMPPAEKKPAGRLIRRGPRPKRLSTWVVPLIIVLLIIVFLPRLLELFE